MTRAAVALLLLAGPAAAQKPARKPPPDGTVFRLAPDAPKHVTADVEFRDPDEKRWPNFFYGKPADKGTFTFDAKRPAGSFTLKCDKMAQKQGDQARRVLGEVAPEGAVPAVTFTLTKCGEVAAAKDAFPVEGTLAVGGKTAAVAGTGTWKFNYAKDAEVPESVQLTLRFAVKGTDLGLSSADPVRATVGCVAYKDLPAKK
ncbi:MAG: hypothetical protein C0501_31650 [Isosphaera sp.]|nr:hypothetical protein [Isosphaera sp.]